MLEALVISQVLLWVAVIVLSVLCLALARQVGVLHERVAPAGALSMNQNLQVGAKAPIISATTLDGEELEIGKIAAEGRSTLIFFLSPDCPICKQLLPMVRSSLSREKKWINGIIASDGGLEAIHRDIAAQHKLSNIPYVLSEELGRAYGVSKLPYAVLIDEKGLIASMGMVNSREHIESLFEAKERGVASIQDFIANKKN
ncbi:MAG TPA: methylamine dehydrogenase accessory protein MauD [Hellea balneolensis]|uniref:Methylamine utilization protein MauD n=1 Tax=Hellea balneolensis TaxID=287478 RepID=A0A7C3G5J6_9PROT|nr:methylamine dehydrogenase accessory protein MauD [Hellea balneolensis]